VTGLSEAIVRAYSSCSAMESVRRAPSPAAQHAHSGGDGYQPPIPAVPPPSLEGNAGSGGRSSGHCINDDSLRGNPESDWDVTMSPTTTGGDPAGLVDVDGDSLL
jgi:hypothetical protein